MSTDAVLPPATPDLRVIVVQDGARLHYAIPLALQRSGVLDRVYTTWYAKRHSPAWPVLQLAHRLGWSKARRMMDRHHPELDDRRVRTAPLFGLGVPLCRRFFSTSYAYYRWEARLIGRWIARRGFGAADSLFGFIRATSPELCARALEAGLHVVIDQMIATRSEELAQQHIQIQRYPQWGVASPPETDTGEVVALEKETWPLTSRITCASDYVRQTLVEAGVDPQRIHVLPYPIEASRYVCPDRRHRGGPVTVGFVGSVGLRKGTPYFLEVARRLAGITARFVLVGPAPNNRSLFANHGNVEVVGSVPRSEVSRWLDRFDLFLFPSTCEGSAGSVMEAMACGLPIVTSPNSGTVVRHWIDGFIHPYDDIDALTASVERLISDPQLRHDMGRSARQRVEQYSIDNYAAGLVRVLTPDVRQAPARREHLTRDDRRP